MTKKERVYVFIGLVVMVILLFVAGYWGGHSKVKARVVDVQNGTVTCETLNGQLYSFYADDTELKIMDHVSLLLRNNDQTTWKDDEVIKVYTK